MNFFHVILDICIRDKVWKNGENWEVHPMWYGTIDGVHGHATILDLVESESDSENLS